MTTLTIVSPAAQWHSFMVDRLSEEQPFDIPEGGENKFRVQMLPESGAVSEIVEAAKADKQVALFTHGGMGQLADYLQTNGVSILNGSSLADGMQTNADFVTLQAAKARFFVAPVPGDDKRSNFVVLRTKRGVVSTWLSYEEHTKLHNSCGVYTSEGITLQVSPHRFENVERNLEAMCRNLGYKGFLFVSGVVEGDELNIESIKPYGPEAFWPAFFAGFTGNITKFFFKMENSRSLMPAISFSEEPITCLKASFPPYPYHKAHWIEDPKERAFVEEKMSGAILGETLDNIVSDSSVVWLGTTDMAADGLNKVPISVEVAYISNTKPEAIKFDAARININLQVKEI